MTEKICLLRLNPFCTIEFYIQAVFSTHKTLGQL